MTEREREHRERHLRLAALHLLMAQAGRNASEQIGSSEAEVAKVIEQLRKLLKP